MTDMGEKSNRHRMTQNDSDIGSYRIDTDSEQALRIRLVYYYLYLYNPLFISL